MIIINKYYNKVGILATIYTSINVLYTVADMEQEGTQNMQQPPDNPKYNMVAGDCAITPNNWFNEKPINNSQIENANSTVTVNIFGTINIKTIMVIEVLIYGQWWSDRRQFCLWNW